MHNNKKPYTIYSKNTSKYLRNVKCYIYYKFCNIDHKFYYIKLINWCVQLSYWKFITLLLCRLFPCDTPTKAIRYAYSPLELSTSLLGWICAQPAIDPTWSGEVAINLLLIENQSDQAVQPCNRFWAVCLESKIWDTGEKMAKSQWYFAKSGWNLTGFDEIFPDLIQISPDLIDMLSISRIWKF